jgi:hypothetical protein
VNTIFALLAQAAPGTDPLLDWLSRAGAIGVLSAAVIAFLRGWIVPRSTHERVIAERDRAVALSEKQNEIAWRALEAAMEKP